MDDQMPESSNPQTGRKQRRVVKAALGMVFGAMFGLIFGAALGNQALGLIFGAWVGLMFGTAMDMQDGKNKSL